MCTVEISRSTSVSPSALVLAQQRGDEGHNVRLGGRLGVGSAYLELAPAGGDRT
jgi:hypothetical protein